MNLQSELASAFRAVVVADWEHLRALGCAEGFAGADGIGVDHIAGDEARPYYRPGGRLRAFILPIGIGGKLVNLMAWRPGRARLLDRAWMRTDAGGCLGYDAIARARRDGAPLRIYRSPATWARNRRDGAVIVDWRCDVSELLEIPEIIAEEPAHAAELERRLKRARFACLPPMPAIRSAAA